MCDFRACLHDAPRGWPASKLVMVLRTWDSTDNVLRPQTEQTGVLFWTYQPCCWTDICDNYQELEESDHESIRNSKHGARVNGGALALVLLSFRP